MIVRHLIVHGRVQGVWYRGWAVETAKALGLGGWVRNRSDGRVELLIAGSEAAVLQMIARCREGPPAARVERIEIEERSEAVSASFRQRPTV